MDRHQNGHYHAARYAAKPETFSDDVESATTEFYIRRILASAGAMRFFASQNPLKGVTTNGQHKSARQAER